MPPRRREKPSAANSLESLLSCAADSERQRVEELIAELQRLPPEEQAKSQAPAIAAPVASEVVAKTRAEAARLLDVDVRTLSEWATDPSFPGKAGTAGQRNGHFPIEAIKQWRDLKLGTGNATRAPDDPAVQLRLRKLAAETAKREVELERECAKLIDREAIEDFVVSQISTARSLLEELPDLLVDKIPTRMAKLRRMARRVARDVVASVLQSLADLSLGDPDDDDDDESGSSGDGRKDSLASKPPRAAKDRAPSKRRVGGRKAAKA